MLYDVMTGMGDCDVYTTAHYAHKHYCQSSICHDSVAQNCSLLHAIIWSCWLMLRQWIKCEFNWRMLGKRSQTVENVHIDIALVKLLECQHSNRFRTCDIQIANFRYELEENIVPLCCLKQIQPWSSWFFLIGARRGNRSVDLGISTIFFNNSPCLSDETIMANFSGRLFGLNVWSRDRFRPS